MRDSRLLWVFVSLGLSLGGLLLIGGGYLLADRLSSFGLNSSTSFTVYMDPAGSNANDGLAPTRGVQSLERVEDILEERQPREHVQVRIKPGTYISGQTSWSFYVPGKTISFLPVGYQEGTGLQREDERPRFLGEPTDGWWFLATLPDGHPGGDTGLRFYSLEVSGYSQGGIKLNGGVEVVDGLRAPASKGMNGNIFRDMLFYRLGDGHSPGAHGFGGIDLVNSSRNLVTANVFSRLENNAPNPGHIHGVYLAHHSSANVVADNAFHQISGDPVRVRNDSNSNEVTGNTFALAGAYGYSEWFCDDPTVCPEERECASHGNRFHENTLISGYGSEDIGEYRLDPPGLGYMGGDAGCDNDGQARLGVRDNALVRDDGRTVTPRTVG